MTQIPFIPETAPFTPEQRASLREAMQSRGTGKQGRER